MCCFEWKFKSDCQAGAHQNLNILSNLLAIGSTKLREHEVCVCVCICEYIQIYNNIIYNWYDRPAFGRIKFDASHTYIRKRESNRTNVEFVECMQYKSKNEFIDVAHCFACFCLLTSNLQYTILFKLYYINHSLSIFFSFRLISTTHHIKFTSGTKYKHTHTQTTEYWKRISCLSYTQYMSAHKIRWW